MSELSNDREIDIRTKSSISIDRFISGCKLKSKSSRFDCDATVYDLQGNILIKSNCTCNYRYDIGYMESQMVIYWDFNNDVMSQLNLRGHYGVNFQQFSWEERVLKIHDADNNRQIELKRRK